MKCLEYQKTQLVFNSLWHAHPVKSFLKKLRHVRPTSSMASQPCSGVHHALKTIQCALRAVG